MAVANAHAEKRRNFKDAGRACPLDYRLDPAIFSAPPAEHTDTLYVVGGLYGNPFALDAIEAMAADEAEKPLIVLNGDTHWFDKTAENFMALERRMEPYIPLVGNVEAELRRQTDIGVGCGCSYPSCTSDASVSRSNRIHKMLSIAVHEHPECKEPLEGRAAAMTVDVAGVKVGITHGDEKLIGGWDCSRESLEDPLRQDELSRWMRDNDIRVFATTHTCAVVAMALADGLLINNGAAGLPCFSGQHFGIITRIATTPAKEALFGAQIDGVWVQAVPVRYDHDAYLEWFDALWPRLSPGAVSYRGRIVDGPDDRISEALMGGFTVGEGFEAEASAVRHDVGREAVDEVFAKVMYFDDLLDADLMHTVDEPKYMQINIGKLCNLACEHCHVEAGPNRTELMDRKTMQAVLDVMDAHGMETLDITGGAPEMNPDFEWLLKQAAERGFHIMVRSNLCILDVPKYAHLLDVYARLGVEIVASLPALNGAQYDTTRGHGFDPCIRILHELNARGYGRDGAHVLDLVYNPQTPYLCPVQSELEAMYKRRLEEDHGIVFDKLFAVANCPIGRYGVHLAQVGDLEDYLDLLMDNFNIEAARNMMCLKQVAVGYDGRVYDCDFNNALGLCAQREGRDITIFDYAADPNLSLQRDIVYGNHCYACAAGQGSSCGGTLLQGA